MASQPSTAPSTAQQKPYNHNRDPKYRAAAVVKPQQPVQKVWTYEVLQTLSPTTTLWYRKEDGERFLGSKFTTHGAPYCGAIIRLEKAGKIFNHNNLVSMADFVKERDATGQVHQCLLWDLCDAGTLLNLLREPPVEATETGFFPESLIWHVGRSVGRALGWLHEGWDGEFKMEKDDDGNDVRGEAIGFQKGWMPILHRAVRAENVFFQHPRGTETYGLCKLGNFGSCHVSAVASLVNEVTTAAHQEEHETTGGEMLLRELKRNKLEDVKAWEVPHARRAYTIGSELFALGWMMWRMMTNIPAPEPEECPVCDCWHLRDGVSTGDCPHAGVCGWAHMDWEDHIKTLTDYTPELRDTVSWLVQLHGRTQRAADAVRTMDNCFDKWRRDTPDGKLFVELEDDFKIRDENLKAQRKEVAFMRGHKVTDL